MSTITLPKNALEKIQLGQAFAEYDLIRNDPQLFVTTPATLAALNPEAGKCFFVGRRGAGKTAITYELQRKFPRNTLSITPQIFDLLRLPLAHEEFRDTRQRPFKSLMHTMERALIDECLRNYIGSKQINPHNISPTISKERNLIEDCEFDQRILNLTQEIFDTYAKSQDKLWLRQISRSKELADELDKYESLPSSTLLLIDRLDESWDGSETAIIALMALMHASVRLAANTKYVRPYIFIRENIYDRIRLLDNEFSRLETSVVFLDWSEPKLIELVERRLVRPFSTKPKLGGDAWNCFFEEAENHKSSDRVLNLCQHRPRDVVMLVSYAIEAAVSNGHQKIGDDDLSSAATRYSTSRLKDLGDEFAENYPNISIVLESFYGLGNEYTLVGIDDFISKLLVDEKIKKHCATWFYDYTTALRFVGLLFDIGFIGLKRRGKTIYKETGKDTNAKLPLEADTHIVIHQTYQPALNLREILIQKLTAEVALKHEGMLEDLPENYRFDTYKEELQATLQDLQTLPYGHEGAAAFEEITGKIIQLCFFRALSNVQPRVRTHDGSSIRDWVASNRATGGFWSVIREKYGATQVVFECKNYSDLSADDFHQVNYYFSNTFGRFGIIFFRGDEIKDSYFKHISNVANKNQSGLILVLTQRDLEVFLRQAIKGVVKEGHIQDRYDYHVRQVS
jgi:hypothetical protein